MDDTPTIPRTKDKSENTGVAANFRGKLNDLSQNIFERRRRRDAWWRLDISTIIALSVLILGMTARVLDMPWVELVRVKTFDLYQIMAPRETDGKSVVGIVDIDEKSLAEIGQWPWSRTTIADLLNRLADAKASVVGFDAIFAEYDRTSPHQIATTIRGADEETLSKLKALPKNEDVMAAAMRRIATVVGQAGVNTELPEGGLTASFPSSVKGSKGGDPKPFLHPYVAYMGNVPELEKAARGHGFFTIGNEPDGLVRRVPLVTRIGKDVRPALTVEMLRAAFGGKIIFTKQNQAGLTHISLQTPQGAFDIPVDGKGRIWVHFAKPDSYNTPNNTGRLYVSAGDIIKGRVPKEKLAGRIFLVGTSAVGLLDIRATPIAGRLPGVEVHANILETILSSANRKAAAQQKIIDDTVAEAKEQKLKLKPQEIFARAKPKLDALTDEEFYLRYSNFANSIELALILGAGIFMIVFIPRLGPMLTLTSIVFGGAILLGASWYLYLEELILLDISYPGMVTIALYSVLTFANYTREAAEKRQVRSAFGQYLSPALVEQLAENPDQLTLGGETKEMTFLFCDVRGFTTISEQFKENPQDLTVLINRLLTPLTESILAHEGTIDKYMGDCIMAFWNAPMSDDLHMRHSCEAALDMMVELEALNAERRQEAEDEGGEFMQINVGIGINTGECVVGNMGSQQRFDYSVLGDAVNTAARLEGQSKNYGVTIIIGPDTAESVKDEFATLEIDLITVKGKTEAVAIYALLGGPDRGNLPEFKALKEKHDQFTAAYRAQDWDKAETIMAECAKMADGELDELYEGFTDRINEFRADPPGADWDGVYVAETK
jgi:adenylate cyclase